MFSLSDLHIYLTVPFVLSWSLLDALACGRNGAGVGHRAGPRDDRAPASTALLADFFNPDVLAELANQLLDRRDEYRVLGRQAAAIIQDKYTVDVCLPKMVEMYESVKRKPA